MFYDTRDTRRVYSNHMHYASVDLNLHGVNDLNNSIIIKNNRRSEMIIFISRRKYK